MKNIIIRTLGGKEIGYGHFYRCLSLAKGIISIDRDIKIDFMINQELLELIENIPFDFILSKRLSDDFDMIKDMDIDLFIFDSYLGDNGYLKIIKKKTILMLVDDNNDIYDSTIPDILYNGNIYAPSLGYANDGQQLQLLGSKYLIMKEEYWNNEQAENINKEGILVTTGGTDKYGVMLGIIDAIKDANIKIRAVIGPGYSDDYIKKIEEIKMENIDLIYKPNSLKEYINSSKVVITAGGSTVYEILSQRSIPIVFSIANNQDIICITLNQIGVGYLGKYPNIEYSKLGLLLKELYNKNIDKEDEMFSLVTGEGALLVAKEILTIDL